MTKTEVMDGQDTRTGFTNRSYSGLKMDTFILSILVRVFQTISNLIYVLHIM